MAYTFEFMTSLDYSIDNRNEILEKFEICKSFQMPVVEDGYLIGIVDLFDIIRAPSDTIDLKSITHTDFYVAGKDEGIFSFKLTNQDILPFVDSEGKYLGFSNKITIKCYVPSKEYLKIVNMSLPDPINSDNPYDLNENDFKNIEESFDAVIEDNYEGVYVTTAKGKTFAINNKSLLFHNVQNETQLDVNAEQLNKFRSNVQYSIEPADIVQIMQERNEISLMRIFRRNIDIEKEMQYMQNLAEMYKQQLDAIEIEKNVSEKFICNSPDMKKIMKLISQVSKVDSTILLEGDSGVGKSMMSKAIHENSLRKDGPFITIDCATLPPNLLESELFGYERGSFTGAEKAGKIGLVELANNGTLFLDEIAEIPLQLQAKLLRMLQDHIIYRIGGKNPIKIDVRVIVATNRNLEQMVEQKLFRTDLYYRLRVIPIKIPPLSMRKEDVRPLIDFFVKKYNIQYKLNRQLSTSAYRALINYSWPGNVRELQNTIEYLLVTASNDLIRLEDIPFTEKRDLQDKVNLISSYSNCTLKTAIDDFEKNLIITTMEKTKSTLEMALLLGTDRSTIIRKLQKYGIKTNFKENGKI